MVENIDIRRGRPADRDAIRSVLEMAGLEPGNVASLIDRELALVAIRQSTEVVVGVAILASEAPQRDRPREGPANHPNARHLLGIAVRPGARGSGIGSMLLDRAISRHGTLTAAFDPDVWDFYERLGFERTAKLEDGRWFAVRTA